MRTITVGDTTYPWESVDRIYHGEGGTDVYFTSGNKVMCVNDEIMQEDRVIIENTRDVTGYIVVTDEWAKLTIIAVPVVGWDIVRGPDNRCTPIMAAESAYRDGRFFIETEMQLCFHEKLWEGGASLTVASAWTIEAVQNQIDLEDKAIDVETSR